MSFTLMELPYRKDALAPHMSAETLDYRECCGVLLLVGDFFLTRPSLRLAVALPLSLSLCLSRSWQT
jgi:hypothetical protein